MGKKLFMFAIMIFFLLTIFSNFVNGAQPVQVSTNTGMVIDYPKYDLIKQGNEHRFHVHVINATSSKTNKTTSCIFHLYNQTGYDINQESTLMEFESYNNVDFALTIGGGNFSSVGLYSYVIQCNSTNEIAFASGQLEVNPSGIEPTTAQGLVYSLLLITSLAFMIFFFMFCFILDGNNKFTMGGDLIELNANKYFKLGLFFAGYLFTIFSTYLAWQISSQFLLLDLGTAIFKTMFTILWIFAIPLFFIVVILGIMKWLFDLKLEKLAERGLKPR